MTDDQLIAQQARRIADLEEIEAEYRKVQDDIRGIIYCIGGPLNDNKLGYTAAQMVTFSEIIEALN